MELLREEQQHYDVPSACIICGKVLDSSERGTIDHYIPLCVTGSHNERSRGIENPFLEVVKDPNNLFKICSKEAHDDKDNDKIAAFLGLTPNDNPHCYLEKIGAPHTRRGDPVALIKYLMENYPITPNIRFRRAQIRRMITINNQFRSVAYKLNGDLDHDLTVKYHNAAALIGDFNRKLHSLRPSNDLSALCIMRESERTVSHCLN